MVHYQPTWVKSLYEDDEGLIWLGTWSYGLDFFDPATEKVVKHLDSKNSPLNEDNVWAVLKDSYGDVWISTLGYGIIKLNNNEFRQYIPFDKFSTSHNNIMTIFEDRDQNIWVGTEGGGYNIYDRSNDQFERYFISDKRCPEITCNDIRTIKQVSNGDVILGTEGGGLICMHSNPDSFTVITIDDGLASNHVRGIEEDKNGNYWISTTSGISKYNPNDKKFITFDQTDGLQSNEFNYTSSLITSSGKIIFGGTNGLNVFDPEQIMENKIPPKVVITDFSIFNKSINSISNGDILSKSITQAKEVRLNHHQSVISFAFAALNYTLPVKNQYAYMMEGFDNEWNYVGTARTATYTNLDPGTYHFKVKASNNDGVWNEEGTSVKIVIKPPIWQTWWFRTILIMLVIVLIVLVIRARDARLKEQQKHLKFLVEQKTEELVNQNNEIAKQRDDLEVLSNQIRVANENKISFFTNISHEFRTPLSLISSPLDKIINNENTSRSNMDDLNVIKRNTNRLLKLVNQLLDFRKMEKDTMPITISNIDVVKFVTEIQSVFREEANRKNITYGINFKLKPKDFWIDEDKLEKIVYNLLSNAFKFTQNEGEISLKLNTYSKVKSIPNFNDEVNPTTDYLQITVTNTGLGIDSDNIEKIFERFHQVNETKENSIQGTGIGLALSKKLARLHQGDLTVSSVINKSTSFYLTIPISKSIWDVNEQNVFIVEDSEIKTGDNLVKSNSESEEDSVEVINFLQESSNYIKNSEGKPYLLIVEDNLDLQRLVGELFNEDYQVINASDGKIGLEKAFKYSPQVIISDINMPVMNGVELCNELKKDIRTSHIPILLLTAKTTKTSQIEGLQVGADDYVTKPFDNDLLILRVKNIVDTRQRLKEKFAQDVFATAKEVTVSSTDETFLKDAITYIEDNVKDSSIDGTILAKELGVSKSVLYKKIKELTDQTVHEFIKSIRLKYAAQYFLKTDYTSKDIYVMVGFKDPNYFSKSFKKQFGLSPREFKKSKRY